MNVYFLTIEDVTSGLFRTQVMDLARSVSNLDLKVSIRIVAVNRPWKLRSHLIALKKHRELLIDSNVRITYIPILPPLRGAVAIPLVSEILVVLLRLCSVCVSLLEHVDVWHARGYWTTMALQRNQRKNLLFDPRSLWILENQSAGNLAFGSDAYKYWLSSEKIITESSRCMTVVSKGMKDYYDRHYNTPEIHLIPISANEIFFKFDSEIRHKLRRQLGWDHERVFVYSGSFGLSGINTTALADMFRYVLSCSSARLLILSDDSEDRIQGLLSSIPVHPSQIVVIRPDPAKIGEWLNAADIGLHALPRQLDASTRLGTKVVEYWANGLPVIVNHNVGAACDYIRENSYLGRVINFDEEIPIVDNILIEITKYKRDLIQSFAMENFHGSLIAKKYIHAYQFLSDN